MAPVGLLENVDQVIGRIVREPFCLDRSDDIIFAELLKLLVRVFGSLHPERVVLARLALVWDLCVQQSQSILHCHQVLQQDGGRTKVA